MNTKKLHNGTTRKDPEYSLTKDGLAILAMGFTGKKAMQFKIAYLNAFNQMQDIITKRLYGEGFTLTELRKKVPCQSSNNLFANENTPVYLLSDVMKYLGYAHLSSKCRHRYRNLLVKLDGRIWAHEEFVKMKMKSKSASNFRKQVLESCERIALAEAEREKFIKKLKSGGRYGK